MAFIPRDLWLHIAQFMSQDDLRGMLCVNGTFFQLAMDAKYRDIVFTDFDDVAMKKMRRLREPTIAYRVRRLHVNIWFCQKAVKQYIVWQTSAPTSQWHSTYSSSFDEVIQIMVDTIACLSNVIEIFFEWKVPPEEGNILPLLTSIWRTIGSNLQKVILSAPLENFPVLLSTAGSFPALREVGIKLRDGDTLDEKPPENNSLISVVVPFINSVARTLRILSITSWAYNVDLSLLFRSLENFSSLERLNILVDFNLCGLSEPRGLTRILRSHAATLRHVQFAPFDGESASGNMLSINPFALWLTNNQCDGTILSNLRTLQTVIPWVPEGLYLIVGYIKRSADTLTSLSLLNYKLSYDEVQIVMSVFSPPRSGPQLKDLRLQVWNFSINLLLLLARTFPYLDKLSLAVSNVEGKEQDTEEANDWEDELRIAREFAVELRKQDLHGWLLRDIEIVRGGGDDPLMFKIVNLLGECIPSLQIFHGVDKLEFSEGAVDPL